ncbi:25460_t:CDS:1, partial [Gigaspora rosea]
IAINNDLANKGKFYIATSAIVILAGLGLYLLWTPKSKLPKLLTRSKESKIQKQTEK